VRAKKKTARVKEMTFDTKVPHLSQPKPPRIAGACFNLLSHTRTGEAIKSWFGFLSKKKKKNVLKTVSGKMECSQQSQAESQFCFHSWNFFKKTKAHFDLKN